MFRFTNLKKIRPCTVFVLPEEFKNRLIDYSTNVEKTSLVATPLKSSILDALMVGTWYSNHTADSALQHTTLDLSKFSGDHFSYLLQLEKGGFFKLYNLNLLNEYADPNFWINLINEVEQPEELVKKVEQLGNNIYLLPPLVALIDGSRDNSLTNRVEKCVKLLKKTSSRLQRDADVTRRVNFAFKELGWLAQKVEVLTLTSSLEEDYEFKQSVLDVSNQLEAMWFVRKKMTDDPQFVKAVYAYLEKHNWLRTYWQNNYKTNVLLNRRDIGINKDYLFEKAYLNLVKERRGAGVTTDDGEEEKLTCFNKNPLEPSETLRRFVSDWVAFTYTGKKTFETLRREWAGTLNPNKPSKLSKSIELSCAEFRLKKRKGYRAAMRRYVEDLHLDEMKRELVFTDPAFYIKSCYKQKKNPLYWNRNGVYIRSVPKYPRLECGSLKRYDNHPESEGLVQSFLTDFVSGTREFFQGVRARESVVTVYFLSYQQDLRPCGLLNTTTDDELFDYVKDLHKPSGMSLLQHRNNAFKFLAVPTTLLESTHVKFTKWPDLEGPKNHQTPNSFLWNLELRDSPFRKFNPKYLEKPNTELVITKSGLLWQPLCDGGDKVPQEHRGWRTFKGLEFEEMTRVYYLIDSLNELAYIKGVMLASMPDICELGNFVVTLFAVEGGALEYDQRLFMDKFQPLVKRLITLKDFIWGTLTVTRQIAWVRQDFTDYGPYCPADVCTFFVLLEKDILRVEKAIVRLSKTSRDLTSLLGGPNWSLDQDERENLLVTILELEITLGLLNKLPSKIDEILALLKVPSIDSATKLPYHKDTISYLHQLLSKVTRDLGWVDNVPTEGKLLFGESQIGYPAIPQITKSVGDHQVSLRPTTGLKRQLFALPELNMDHLIMWEYLVSSHLEKFRLERPTSNYDDKRCTNFCECILAQNPTTDDSVFSYGWPGLNNTHLMLSPVDLWRSTRSNVQNLYKQYFTKIFKRWARGEVLAKPLNWPNWLFTRPKTTLVEAVLDELLFDETPALIKEVTVLVRLAADINLLRNKKQLFIYKNYTDILSPLWLETGTRLAALSTKQTKRYKFFIHVSRNSWELGLGLLTVSVIYYFHTLNFLIPPQQKRRKRVMRRRVAKVKDA